jgi:hypothetical protein
MAFSWSYSKYKNYFTCPKRHYEVDIAKNYKDSSEALDYGNEVHDAFHGACGKDIPLPEKFSEYQQWVDKYAAPGLPGKLYVEQQYAITQTFHPTQWFAKNAWFRAVVDLLRVDGPVARAVDWKTGNMKHDSRQLMLSTVAIFAHHPRVERVLTEFVWLGDGITTQETFDRNSIRNELPPVLEGVKEMMHASATLNYPPKPGKLCAKWCPVTSCPFHGKRHS